MVYSMDESADDESTATSAGLNEALDRLTHRYAPDTTRLPPVDALTQVYQAQMTPVPHRPTPTEQDLADALLLVTKARDDLVRSVDLAELTVIDALRSRWGWTLERIGIHLGRPAQTARQNANNRYQRLRGAFPRFQSAEPDVATSPHPGSDQS